MLGVDGLDSIALRYVHNQLLDDTRALMRVTYINMLSDENVPDYWIRHPEGEESHITIGYNRDHGKVVTLHAVLHVSNSASDVFKLIGNIGDFMASTYQALAQLITMSFDSSKLWESKIGAH